MKNESIKDSTKRFTKTVENYVKYRPSYPKEVLQVLIERCDLTKDKIIADIGSGTGLLSKLLLDHGNIVYGIEPNQAMRDAAHTYLINYPNFYNQSGTAEASSLEDNSIDVITSGTAFHWFDLEKSKKEFKRILKTPGWVMLVWNVRNLASPLIQDYEALILKYGTDYKRSNAIKFNKAAVADFFSPFEMKIQSFENKQYFDWSGFQGRLLSTSYSLQPGDTGYENMIHDLKFIFDRRQKNGTIEFLYHTKLYYGRLK